MKPKKLRWGLLSTARINRRLIPPLKVSKRNMLTSVASRNLEHARQYAQEWDIPRVFGAYDEMLADPDIDVVYVSLPNSLHAEWTIKALLAGKHVLCEKPLATRIEDVDAIIEATAQTGKVAAEAFMYRHHAQTLKARELVQEGAIGEQRLVRGVFSFYLDQPGNVRLEPALDGGSLWDVGCYPVSYARWLAGCEPGEAFGWQITGPSGVETHFTGQLRFPGEVFAQFDSSFCTAFRASMELVGSQGYLSIPKPFVPSLREKMILVNEGKTRTIPVYGKDLYLDEVEDLADAILEEKPPRVSLADSRANTACLLALYQSVKTGAPQKVGLM